MKKLVTAACALAASMVLADVKSQVVGFTAADSVAQNNFLTIPFNTIGGYNTANITNIVISDGGNMGIGWGQELFSIWEGAPSVADGTSFFYWDASIDPEGLATTYYWGDQTGAACSFIIAGGQGVVIDMAEDLSVIRAGQVSDENVTFTSIAQNNFTGNPFPEPLPIQNIVISDGGNMGIGWGQELFSIWEGAPTVADGTSFFYWDASIDPEGLATTYYWGDQTGSKVSYGIAAGQGAVIDMTADLDVSIAAPYTLPQD